MRVHRVVECGHSWKRSGVQDKKGLEEQLKGSKDRERLEALQQKVEAAQKQVAGLQEQNKRYLEASRRLGRQTVEVDDGKRRVLETVQKWADRVAPLLQGAEAAAAVRTPPTCAVCTLATLWTPSDA